MNGIKLSTNEKLKKFLEETSIDKILMLYDIEQNDDDKNLENIKLLDKENQIPSEDAYSYFDEMTLEYKIQEKINRRRKDYGNEC